MATFGNLLQLVISATNEPSDIQLDTEEDRPLLINYYARNNLTWTQHLSDNTYGIPPTGGLWVPILSGELILPSSPHAYLTNRHFPTYAAVPYIGKLYTARDTGGFFIPKMLGVSTFLSRNRVSQLDTLNTIELYPENRGTQVIYQNPNNYTTDQGLTRTDQIVPVSTIVNDQSWIKDNIAEHNRAPFINSARYHQEFNPYQTKYETTIFNEYGIRRQGDGYDPWFNKFDITWENDTDFPPNFKEQHNILEWYEQFNTTNYQIYKWKTDIYGNQFALFKQLSGLSIYEKRKAEGFIWTRDARNIVKPASASMELLYDKFQTELQTPLLSTNIYDIDIWYDVMMFWTPALIAIAKIDFNFETNTIFTIADNIHKLWLCDTWFAGTWFFEQDKKVTVGTLGSAEHFGKIYFYPILRELDLETNIFSLVYTGSGNTDCQKLTSMALSAIEDPIFTYNTQTQIFNTAFIGTGYPFCGMNFVSIDVKQTGDTFNLYGIRATTPVWDCEISSSSSSFSSSSNSFSSSSSS